MKVDVSHQRMNAINFVILFSSILLCIKGDDGAEVDHSEAGGGGSDSLFRHLCNPNMFAPTHSRLDDEHFCECRLEARLVGAASLKIDCMTSSGVTNLTEETFRAEKLPVNTKTLILSYQSFSRIPFFEGSLKDLDLSNNLIAVIQTSNFERVKSLETLDLAYNRIETIEDKAFESLSSLHYLDLTANLLVIFPAHTLAPLAALRTLKVSSNEGFGRIMGRDRVNSSSANLYLHLGLTTALESLEMERCNLTKVNLTPGVGLRHLNLGFNHIADFSKLELPGGVQKLELSGNPAREIRAFGSNALIHVFNVTELILEDMPFLGTVEEFSLHFPHLEKLSLEGSKNLSSFHPSATNLHLKVLNLRGCNLRTLDESMREITDGLQELHLDGNPFTCDCELQWMKSVALETNLRCNKPDHFHAALLSEIEEDDMKCSKMSMFMRKLVNSLILLALLVGCSIAIWCFFRQLSPRSRRKEFQKVGPESPYQRVTIEPNRAEYSL